MRPRLELEQLARRADAVYQQSVLPNLTSRDEGKFVALDLDSGEFEVDADEAAAEDRLLARRPDAAGWLMRVGHRAAYDLLAGS